MARTRYVRYLLTALYAAIGIGTLVSGIWMLFWPHGWYAHFPASIPDTGAFNSHFIRDLGVAFTVAGAAALWCARNVMRCRAVHIGLTLFFIGHALVHAADLCSGRLPLHHWIIDLPAVFGTAIALVALTPFVMRGHLRQPRETHTK